jgi:methylthioribulose-1-phosphate dehydratase
MFSDKNLKLATELLSAIHFFNQKNWSPATSTNYSVRSQKPDEYIISRSGVDKSLFQLEDLIMIDGKENVLPPFHRPGIKSSAETEIHTFLYHTFPEVRCVLHTHSVLGTVISQRFSSEKHIRFEGFEILKGLEGNQTHECSEILPIVANSQEMKEIIDSIKPRLKPDPKPHGFLIAGHGLYTWGTSIAAAKRHIETFEFLFECLHATGRY